MKKTITLLFIIGMLLIQMTGFSQIYFTGDVQSKIKDASSIAYRQCEKLPIYIKMQAGKEVEFSNWQTWIKSMLKLSPDMGFVYQNSITDKKGDIHYRYGQTYNGVPVFGKTFIVHTCNGRVYSFNGDIISLPEMSTSTSMTEQAALAYALASVNAVQYKWQIPSEEALLKQITGNSEATYFPKGELYIVPDSGNTKSQNFKLAYRFDVYAHKPLSRSYIYVDATTGQIIFSRNRIETTDTPGTAITKYSGTQPIVSDSYSGSYRLREAGRGNGIETYNLATANTYGGAVDFTDADNTWNNVNAAQDEVATDAHWGAEKTYDYYLTKFNRNSIDGAGMKLLSYVHYDVGYDNAFWDGQRMTYGDGDGTQYSPFTALDICGHEITHGLTERTANLDYVNEPGAMNEGYSDIFGTCVEWYARPSHCDWLMGADIGSAFRNMSNPNALGQPDTYLGANWDAVNQEVHQNSSIVSYWFYLSAMGGAGTNDNNDVYNVTAISMDSAAAVAFRTLTVYLSTSSQYADARFYSILSAIDLFGACTPEVETVTNAWYAVGVGPAYDPTVISNFSSNYQTFCSAPATVQFNNMSTNANVFHWNFGDGTTSTQMSPSHTYTNLGHYTVSLVATGGICGTDTLIQASYISVDTANACTVFMPASGTGDTQTSCTGTLFDDGGTGNYTDMSNGTITIAPIGAAYLTLNFTSFAFENNYDYLTIYDGPGITSPVIGAFTGTTLPNGGTIVTTGGSVTLVQTSDQAVNDTGFEMNWQCTMPTAPPITNFKADDTLSCTGTVNFVDLSTNGPVSWFWDFGDGFTSTQQQPTHDYISNGVYTVKLKNGNSFGYDSLTKQNYISIIRPLDPTVVPAARCDSGSVTLTAAGGNNLFWYDAPAGGNLVSTGNSFITPILGASTTYYVENSASQPSQYVGPFDNTIGGGSYSTFQNSRYLIFNCFVPLTLNSVKVFSDTACIRTIQLMDAAGTVIKDTTLFVPAGESRVILNFDIPAGNALRLGMTGVTHLFRNNGGAAFPYTLPGMVSITGTNANQPTYYYFFYNWEVSKSGCVSNRIPIIAGILLPNAQVTPNGNLTICTGQNITLTAQTADTYLWSPNNQTTQSITVSAAGTYSVHITHDTCSANSLPIIVTATSNMPVAHFGYVNIDPVVNFSDSSLYGTTYLWSFGDGGISTLMNPTHTYTANGTYLVTLIVYNACGSDTITLPLDISGASGLSSYDNSTTVSVYPNPSKGSFYLDIQTSLNMDINYRLYDLIGNVIKSGAIRPTGSDTKLLISMSDASKGVYMLKLWNVYLNTTRKVVID